jgi:uncharacterized membrane protein
LPKSLSNSLRPIALGSLALLICLCLAWELWLAPLRPGGSWLALKALPLALPLVGVFSGKRYTYQWSSLLILAYLAEGVTRAWSDRAPSQYLAFAEALLSLAFFACVVTYARLNR